MTAIESAKPVFVFGFVVGLRVVCESVEDGRNCCQSIRVRFFFP